MANLDEGTLKVLLEKGLLKKEDYEKLTNKNKNKKIINLASDKLFIKDIFNEYTDFLKKEFSKNTIEGYTINTKNFLEYYFKMDFDKIDNITVPIFSRENIKDWFEYLASNGYSYSSIRRYKHSVKKFFEFLKEQYNIQTPDVDLINIPSEKSEVIYNILRDEEIREIANYAQSLRDKCIILFAYEVGLRRQEIIEVKKQDIDFENNMVNIIHNGKLDRVGYFSNETKKLLLEYLSEWENEVREINEKRYLKHKNTGIPYKKLLNSEYLFQTVRSPKISYSTIFKAIKDAYFNYCYTLFKKQGNSDLKAKELAEEKTNNIDIETLRQSRRVYLFSIGKTLDEVQIIMGDENRYICKRYLKIAQHIYPEKFIGNNNK